MAARTNACRISGTARQSPCISHGQYAAVASGVTRRDVPDRVRRRKVSAPDDSSSHRPVHNNVCSIISCVSLRKLSAAGPRKAWLTSAEASHPQAQECLCPRKRRLKRAVGDKTGHVRKVSIIIPLKTVSAVARYTAKGSDRQVSEEVARPCYQATLPRVNDYSRSLDHFPVFRSTAQNFRLDTIRQFVNRHRILASTLLARNSASFGNAFRTRLTSPEKESLRSIAPSLSARFFSNAGAECRRRSQPASSRISPTLRKRARAFCAHKRIAS